MSQTQVVYLLEIYDRETDLIVEDIEILLNSRQLSDLLHLDIKDDLGYGYDLTPAQVDLLQPYLTKRVDDLARYAFQLGSKFAS